MEKREKFVQVTIIILLFIVLMIVLFILIRKVTPSQLDDVSPNIPCDKELLENSDILYIIPKYNNISIAENKGWCNYILSLNKTLAMHGVYHIYQEFKTNKDQKYLDEGIDIFKSCFNKTPVEFKAPQLAIDGNNKDLIKTNMEYRGYFNQLTHKAYHCSNTGKFSNKFIDWF